MIRPSRFPAAIAASILSTLAVVTPDTRASEALTEQQLQAAYQHLHQNPELSLQEEQTAAYLADHLEAMGYQVTRNIGGHGLVALLQNGDGPTIMYRADMDGLPVAENTGLPFASKATGLSQGDSQVPVMHACGHDVHMTVLLGVAAEMMAHRGDWHGTLELIGQPAEELGAGALAMLQDGLFTRFPQPDLNLALHVYPDLPVGTIGYAPEYAMANVDEVDVTIYGKGGHGAYPESSIDPIMMSAEIITMLQTIVSRELSALEPAVITVGSIHGGSKHNIIPDEVKLQLTVRSYADDTRAFLLRRIEEISQGIARTAGVPEDRLPEVVVTDEYTPSVYNNPALTEQVVDILRKGPSAAPVVKLKPSMAGEDFSRYGRTDARIPSLLLWLGVTSEARIAQAKAQGTNLPSLHSAKFVPDAVPAIEAGVAQMSAVLVALFAEGVAPGTPE
ncbi:M20 metallopeptidase family protein [Haliea sp. E17]|uniref:M20 metallopeptidase family protein n=1 Tax=Haliea sp. E17 TaxID=3401576 RepID=UPI003AADB1CA